MLVSDSFLSNTDPVKRILSQLEKDGFEVTVFSEVVADPSIELIDEAANQLKHSKSEAVVAVGGGSTIDSAKAMCMLATNEGSVRDYLFGGTKSVSNNSLPLIVIPTTAGSGSEVTAASVISDNQNNIKLSVTHESMFPKYAVIDPIMHCSMPAIVTASTGMDAMTHAIEAYVSLNANPISDAYAKMAIQMIGENIVRATFCPNDLEARGKMALASVMGATAFASAGLGAVHGISQALGGIAHTPHGIANALLLPYVMEVNVVGNINKFADIAKLLGETSDLSIRDLAGKSIELVKQLCKDLRIPQKFSQLEELNLSPISREMFQQIVLGTMNYRMLSLNPVKLREEDIYHILEMAYE